MKTILLAAIFILLIPSLASAQWWNSSWLYRAPINITNNNITQTLEQGYTVNITFNHSALVQSGKSLASGNDVRMLWHDSTPWWNSSWNYRKKITITNNNLSQVLEQNYTVNLTLNMNELGQAGKMNAAGNDTRIVWWNGTSNIELDRILEPSSAVAFDGSNDYINLPQSCVDNLGASTIEGWFKTNINTTTKIIFGRKDPNDANTIYIGLQSVGKLVFGKGGQPTELNSVSTIQTGRWYHFAAVSYSSGGVHKLYIDGQEEGSVGSSNPLGASIEDCYIGNSPERSYYWDGLIDEFRISSVARYAANFTPPRAPFTPDTNTIALYHFDNTTSTQVWDSSGNANHGTQQGGAYYTSGYIVPDTYKLNTLWFKLQKNISANSWNDSYYVYYGNPSAGAAPANGSNVYLFYDDFSTDQFSGDDDTCYVDTANRRAYCRTHGAVEKSIYSLLSINISSGYQLDFEFTMLSIGSEWGGNGAGLSAKTTTAQADADNNRFEMYQYFSSTTDFRMRSSYDDAFSPTGIDSMDLTVRYHGRLRRISGSLISYVYTTPFTEQTPIDTGTLSISGTPAGAMSYVILGSFVQGANRFMEAYFYDLKLRKYLSPEPSASLGTEQGQSRYIELDRVNTTAFNNATNLTVVWFKLQQNIPAGGIDANYSLYYGNPSAGAAPANKSNVWDLYDAIDYMWKLNGNLNADVGNINLVETGTLQWIGGAKSWSGQVANTSSGNSFSHGTLWDDHATRYGSTGVSFETWVNFFAAESDQGYIWNNVWKGAPNEHGYYFQKQANIFRITAFYNGAYGYCDGPTVNTNTWYHVIWTWSTNYDIKMYINGGSPSCTLNKQWSDNINSPGTYFGQGGDFLALDNIIAYKKVLSQSEITALYNRNTEYPSSKYLSPEPSAVLLAEQIIPVEWSLNASSIPSVYSSAQSQFNITWKSKISMGSALLESNFSGSPKNYSMNYPGNPWWSSDYSYRQPINITNNNLTQTLEQGYTANVTFNHSALVQAGKSLASGNDVRILWHDSTPWWNNSWLYRKKITITNNNLSQVLEQNYTVNITLDTTGSKFVAAGNDTRIVWWNGTNNVELDRINTTAFNAANTSIWFKLQQNISANSWDDNYYVYYGNPSAGAAPANGSNVFLFYDDFNEGGTCYNNNIGPVWSLGGDPLGSTTFNCNSGYLQHNNANGIGAQEWASTPFTYTLGGIDFQFKTRAVAENSEWNVLHLTQTIGRYGVEIIGYGIDVNIMGDPPGTTDNQKLVWSNGSSSYANRLVGQTGYPTTLKTYRATRDQAGNWSFYVDNVYVGSTVHTAFTQINYIELWHVYEGNSYWDDIIIRKFLSPEPSAALGAEQGQSRYIELDRVNTTAFNNATNLTVVWFKTQANIPAGGSDANYSLYYGNPSAGAAPANGSNVYLFYDDFEDYNTGALKGQGGWGGINGDAMNVQTATVKNGNKAIERNGLANYITHSIPSTTRGVITWYMRGSTTGNDRAICLMSSAECGGAGEQYRLSMWINGYFTYYDGINYNNNLPTATAYSANTWYKIEVIFDTDIDKYVSVKIDDVVKGTNFNAKIGGAIANISLNNGGTQSSSGFWDTVIVRKYMSPEPTALLLGEQNVNQSYTFSEVLPAGSFYWKSYANNSAGAWNSSDTWYFSISKVPTLVRLFLNGTEGNKNYIQNLTANFTAVINITGKTVYLQTDLPGWVLQSGTGTVINITNMTQKGLFNVTAYFPGDQNYSSSLQTYFAKVIIPGLYEITTNLALHLGSAFADDSLQSTNQYVCIQDSTGWFGLIGEGGSAKAGNISTEYNINTSFISDNKALLATSKGTCVTFTRYVSSILAKSFLSPLQAFAYAKTNLLQFILKYDYADFLNDLHWSSGTYQVSVRNEGYDSSSGKQKLGTKLVK